MVKIERKYQKVFGENSANNGQFGSAQTGAKVISDDLDVLMALDAWEQGWSAAVVSGEKLPTLEEMQGTNYVNTKQLAYIFQEGVPEYNEDTTYYEFSIVKKEGTFELYGSIIDDNIGNPLSDGASWLLIANLNGENTFAEQVNITGAPSTGAQVVMGEATMSGVNTTTLQAAHTLGGDITITLPSTTSTLGTTAGIAAAVAAVPVTGRLVNIQVLTASGTYTPTAGATAALVMALGAGAGGGGSSTATGHGAGGGAAGQRRLLYISAGLAAQTFVIGAFGAGGANTGTAGSVGGDTSFGTVPMLVAKGGLGGAGATAAATNPGGAGSGAGGSGGRSFPGGPGSYGFRDGAAEGLGGNGASSESGGGGLGGYLSGTGADGAAATGYGAGGGGAGNTSATGRAGGNGSPGLIIVYEYS